MSEIKKSKIVVQVELWRLSDDNLPLGAVADDLLRYAIKAMNALAYTHRVATIQYPDVAEDVS